MRAPLLPALSPRRPHASGGGPPARPAGLPPRRPPAVSKRQRPRARGVRPTARGVRPRGGVIVYADTKRLAILLPIVEAIAAPPAAAILRGTLGRRSATCSG